MKPQLISFGNCVVDVRAGQLLVDGRPRKLDTLAFDLLVQLLMNHGRIVSKQELVDAVWMGRDVAPEVLSRTVMRLRRSVSIDAPGDLIWTIQGRGYRIASGVQVSFTLDPGHAAPTLPSCASPVTASSSAMG